MNDLDGIVQEIQERLGAMTQRLSKTGGAKRWTKEIKQEFCNLGKEKGRHRVAASGCEDADWGEWHYDLCWLEYDSDKRYLVSLPLAMECEWGGMAHICDDFEKLLMSRADLRVMIFHDEDKTIDEIVEHLRGFVSTFSGTASEDRYLLCGYLNQKNTFKFSQIPAQ